MKISKITSMIIISTLTAAVSSFAFANNAHGPIHRTVNTTDNVLQGTVDGAGHIVKSTGEAVGNVGNSIDRGVNNNHR